MSSPEHDRTAAGRPATSMAWPALVGDIGGTNARFAIIESPDAPPSHVLVLKDNEYATFADAIADYLDQADPGPLRGAALAVAGPVDGDVFRFSNIDWQASQTDLARRFGLQRVRFVNDFEALALSIPVLKPEEFLTIGGGDAVDGAPIAVIGPGTGLGVAGLLAEPGGWRAIPAEGGHSDFAPVDDLEISLLQALRPRFRDHVSNENVLCGAGMAALHQAIAEIDGRSIEPLTSAEIVERANASPAQPDCARTIEIYCALLGGFAGNVALIKGARGGVVLGGGILPRIRSYVTAGGFRRRFEAKGQMRDYVAAIPTRLILAGDAALRGAATVIGKS